MRQNSDSTSPFPAYLLLYICRSVRAAVQYNSAPGMPGRYCHPSLEVRPCQSPKLLAKAPLAHLKRAATSSSKTKLLNMYTLFGKELDSNCRTEPSKCSSVSIVLATREDANSFRTAGVHSLNILSACLYVRIKLCISTYTCMQMYLHVRVDLHTLVCQTRAFGRGG